jgi:quinol-cytochrome oxidoreductase complex cytochrome b subunit
MKPNFFHHLHPPTIPARQARWRYTLGAGGLAVFLVLVLIVTGILEMFYYIPTTDKAAQSVQVITYFVPFGGLVRNLHYWSAQLLIVVSLIHLVRIVFTGAYAPPRRFNYLLGLALLVLALFLDFTGYVLRWDEGIHWALVTGTNLIGSIPAAGKALYRFLVGGETIGAATLLRFYAWHIFGLTMPVVILVGWHIFRVRRDGGIAVPPPRKRDNRQRIDRFELVRREVAAMLLASIALLLLSSFVPAPIAPPLGESLSIPSEVHAPWFFLWVQQMLKLGSPFFWGVVVPLAILFLLTLFPYVFPLAKPDQLGHWFPSGNRAAQITFGLVAVTLVVLTLLALLPSP